MSLLVFACVALADCSSRGAAPSRLRDAGAPGSNARDSGGARSGGSPDANVSRASGGDSNPSGGSSGHGGSSNASGGSTSPNATGGNSSASAGTSGAAGTSGSVRTESPWGVAPSHSSSVGFSSWAQVIAASGVDWIRGFDQDHPDTVLPIAKTSGFQLSGIFLFSDPGASQSFPINSLSGFQNYVTTTIAQTKDVVKHYEVWNEPPNFSDDKSPADYAKIVIAAYDAVKTSDASVEVGLAAQSVNLNFMAQALDAGAADHFDYVTVHPYETLGLVDDGWEAEFMSIVPTIRKLLADKNPAKQDVPVWFTELGEPVQNATTPEHQADTLVKAYTLGIAQGALRVHWFEPLDGDSGPFGLLAGGSGSAPKRPSYVALSKLIEALGNVPRYVGWLLLNDAHYAFVFEGGNGAVMIAWTGKDVTDTIDFNAQVRVVDLHTGTAADATSLALTHSPTLVSGVPQSLVDKARANASQPFPWDGDYSSASSVSYSASDGARGLHPLGTPKLVTVDNAPARDASQDSGLSFTVDPNFCAYAPVRLRITAVLRRNAGAAAGFNLKYESSSGWIGTGSWYAIPGSDQWYTQTWTISDPQFVGKWGYNFAFDADSTQNSNYSIQSVTVEKL